jgi:fibronectin-binding autotransporter adhesin
MAAGRLTITNGNTGIRVGLSGDGVWNLTGGTATVKRVELNAFAGTGNGTLNLGGSAELNVGSLGILKGDDPYAATFSGGTLGAYESDFEVPIDVTLENLPVVDSDVYTITFSGSLGGTGGLQKEGAGTMVLNGTNDCSGAFAILEGTFQQDGIHTSAGLWQVSNNATMSGSGATDADVTIDALATLAPSPQLTIEGDVVVNGTFAVDVSGATIDQVVDIGNLNLGGGSSLVVSGVLTEPSYVIMKYATRSGNFVDVSSPAGQGYAPIYDDVAGEVLLVLHGPPVVDISSEDAGSIIVSWPSFSGFNYWLEYRSNMLTGAWADFAPYTNLIGIAEIYFVTNTPGGDVQGYFRVREEE